MPFTAFNFTAELLRAIKDVGYPAPTPIQAAAIPLVLAKHDLMGTAQTGTGKTAAFVLPALQQLLTVPVVEAHSRRRKGKGPRVLILVPTRELAEQVKEAARKYAKYLNDVRIVTILGGMPYGPQYRDLARPIDILIATPGRLMDFMERGEIDFSELEMLILDEADRMLDMGFLEDVKYIAATTPKNRQTLMFSATFDGRIAQLAQQLLKNPQRVDMAPTQEKHTQIEQRLHYVNNPDHKNQLLFHILKDDNVVSAIIFTATKRAADKLAKTLYAEGHTTEALHGGMQQRVRTRTLDRFRRGSIRILVATDVAARGIDVAHISHIFNYDLPRTGEDYTHRIGRTGRAGAFGTAISFAALQEQPLVKRIERSAGYKIVPQVIAGLEPRHSPGNARENSNGKYRGKSNSSYAGSKESSYRFRNNRNAGGQRPYANRSGDDTNKNTRQYSAANRAANPQNRRRNASAGNPLAVKTQRNNSGRVHHKLP